MGIPIGDPTIAGLAKGDCTAAVVHEQGSSAPTQYFYDGVCQFAPDTSPMYKCDTVPIYDASDATTCGQDVNPTDKKACFGLKHGVQWVCLPDDTAFPTPCTWTLQPNDPSNFYTGKCVFPGAKEYKD